MKKLMMAVCLFVSVSMFASSNNSKPIFKNYIENTSKVTKQKAKVVDTYSWSFISDCGVEWSFTATCNSCDFFSIQLAYFMSLEQANDACETGAESISFVLAG